jgi:hypothetical protein
LRLGFGGTVAIETVLGEDGFDRIVIGWLGGMERGRDEQADAKKKERDAKWMALE